MKKFLTKLSSLAALFVAGAAFTACSSDTDITGEDNNGGSSALVGKTYTLKLNAVKGDELTRALISTGSGDNENIDAQWQTSDNIYVYDADWKLYGGKLNPTQAGKESIPVEGKISVGNATEPKAGNTINLLFPRTTWDYSGQDGRLETLAQKYDYATGTTKITKIEGSEIKDADPKEVVFTNHQAIIRFDFFSNEAGTEPMTVKKFSIVNNTSKMVNSRIPGGRIYETNAFAFTAPNATSAYYAISGIKSGDELVLKATDTNGKDYCMEVKPSRDVEDGKFYVIKFKTTKVEDDALTVEAITDNTLVDLNFAPCKKDVTIKILNPDNTLASIEKVGAGGVGGIFLNSGQKALFYGENDTYTSFTGEEGTVDQWEYTYDADGNVTGISYQAHTIAVGSSSIKPSDECYLYNNIMSLTNGFDWKSKENTPDGKKLRGKATFAGLFKDALVKQHDTRPLVLPATTLQQGCYQQLLYNTKFTEVPYELLPATELQPYCYAQMFSMTPIVASPKLPATQLVKGCYNFMFQNCSQLEAITAYATTLEVDPDAGNQDTYNTSTANWVKGVKTSGTFYVNPNFEQTQLDAANYFSQNKNGVYTIDGVQKSESEYMGHNSGVCWTIGTAGIYEGWTVEKAAQ